MQLLQTFARFFPPPRFMTLPSAGVDISDASLKYVQFRHGMSGLVLDKWGDIPIPPQTVQRGDLANREALVTVLKKLKADTGVEYVRVSLPEERAYLFETTIPITTSPRDVRGAVEFHLEENVPLSPRDAFFDYTIIPDADAHMMRLSVAVYARDTILGYYEACREADLIPVAFEVEAQAIARAAVPTGDAGTYMIVDFGQTRTGVGIVHQGSLMFTSTIDTGGIHLSQALMQHIPNLKEPELTRLKNELGLLRTEGGIDTYGALLSPVTALKDELTMRINYWNLRGEHGGERAIEKIILCGGSANLAGLPEYLGEELDIETERAQVWQNALSFQESIPPITRRYSYGYATAIGLALADFIPRL